MLLEMCTLNKCLDFTNPTRHCLDFVYRCAGLDNTSTWSVTWPYSVERHCDKLYLQCKIGYILKIHFVHYDKTISEPYIKRTFAPHKSISRFKALFFEINIYLLGSIRRKMPTELSRAIINLTGWPKWSFIQLLKAILVQNNAFTIARQSNFQ